MVTLYKMFSDETLTRLHWAQVLTNRKSDSDSIVHEFTRHFRDQAKPPFCGERPEGEVELSLVYITQLTAAAPSHWADSGLETPATGVQLVSNSKQQQ